MKKLILLSLVVFGALLISNKTQAQANWEAGLRFGDNIALDATIPIGATPRLHPTIYFDRFGIGAYFDWMFALNGGPTGLKFYPGVGPEFWFGNTFDFAAAGNLGAEYTFDFPLTIGFDWRPSIQFTNNNGFKADRWGFIARFRFGEGVSFSKSN